SDLRLEEGKPELALRIRVVGGGCSGMSYELGWDDTANADDNVTESSGVKVLVDSKSAPYLQGSEIDYVDNNMLGAGFAIMQPNHPLRPGDEVCLFAPVSGGSDGDWVEVTASPLSEDRLAAAVGDPGAGGIVLFSGVVRDETGGRRVKYLEYEAHAPMAVAKMREIVAAVRARWPGVRTVALVHRIG